MAEAKKCDLCGRYFTPNTVDGTQLVGYVKSHCIDIRFNPKNHDEDNPLYQSQIDMCDVCIKSLLSHIFSKL